MSYRRAFTLVELIVVLVIIVILVVFVVPAFERAHKLSNHVLCRNNLKYLAIAAQKYHDTYGSFPPAYVVDAEGNPLYSWRVLLLPFLGLEETYKKFHLDEPWDSEHNWTLLRSMPFHYYDFPEDSWGYSKSTKGAKTTTTYMMVVGPNTISDGSSTVKIDGIADGTSNTILFVETRKKIPWTAPIDLPLEQLKLGIVTGKTKENEEGMGSYHRHGLTNVVFADGNTKTLVPETKPELLRSLAVIDDGGPVDWRSDCDQ